MKDTLTIFISHKMPKDTDAALAIGQLIAANSGSKIQIVVAENFEKGKRLTPEITNAIQDSDIFILLYTGEDEDWGYCLPEAGRFEATSPVDSERSIIVLHDAGVSVPKALSEYISVPVSEGAVFEFLRQLYVERGIYPGIDHRFLHEAAQRICSAFRRTDVIAINFDLVPNFSIEVENSETSTETLEDERIPVEALLMGSQKWQVLFGKGPSTGAWKWGELSEHWLGRALYEPELARMIRTARTRDVPQGCFMRPHKSDELYRLTLRRYEEIDDATRLKFYFTAAPIDLPIFGIHDTANAEELTLYNLVNASWYARRKLIDQLYLELLTYVNSVQVDTLAATNIVTSIKNELRSIDIQANIRGISRPMDATALISLADLMNDERSWSDLRTKVFECAKKTPMDLKAMSDAVYAMAELNQKYYQISAAKYAETAAKLKLPPAPANLVRS